MALIKEDLEVGDLNVGDKVLIGLFSGKIVRIIDWHDVVMVDVEISGVIDRYHISQIELELTQHERTMHH